MGTADGLERVLVAIAARCLSLPPSEIDPVAPLTRYGLDSLTALELMEAISTETGLELTEEAFYEAPSLRTLVLRLLMPVPIKPAGQSPIAAMHADAELGADIDPYGLPPATAGTVLLTGANGFLGVHVLRELLVRGAGEVVCAVRAADIRAAEHRLGQALRRYGVDLCAERVHVIPADIAAPDLGLQAADHGQLARGVSTIVHCAAQVDWASPYEQLRAVNVDATRNLLRLACRSTAKSFHFVSSVMAGYSTCERASFDEDAPAADPAGLPLGYAQSKWVAERLVESARGRGLAATVHRPSLIAGHGVSGVGNDDDLFSRLLRGCVALGWAPELDWQLDACPVDFVASAIAAVASSDGKPPPAIHLRNPRPAHWTEAVLWMNLRGYSVRLESYDRWAERLRSTLRAEHPLYALRAFLLRRTDGEDARYLPELYAYPNVRALRAERSDAMLGAMGLRCERIGARLLERYFDHWIERDLVPPPGGSAAPRLRNAGTGANQALAKTLRTYFGDPDLCATETGRVEIGSDTSLVGELGSWRAGAGYALRGVEVGVQRGDGSRATLDLVLKTKLPDEVVLDVTAEVAALCHPAPGLAFDAYRQRSEFSGARARECALYRSARGVLREHTPLCFGVTAEDPPVLVLERIGDTLLADAANDVSAWRSEFIEAVLSGIAAVHAQSLGDARALASLPLGAPLTACRESLAWWDGLRVHAARWLHPWLGGEWLQGHARLLNHAPEALAWTARESCTLIHGDFSPRNVAVRATAFGPKLCAFDWELARIGLPQRDIVEFLCFVLPHDVPADEMTRCVEFARLALQRAAGCDIDHAWWHAGIRTAVGEFGITRLPMYFLAHRFRPQAFLERVARCWWRFASMLGSEP